MWTEPGVVWESATMVMRLSLTLAWSCWREWDQVVVPLQLEQDESMLGPRWTWMAWQRLL